MKINGIAAELLTDLEELFGLAGGLGHPASAFECAGHWGFAINVQTGLKAGDSLFGMAEVGSGDKDSVEVLFAREHILIIDIGVHIVLIVMKDFYGPPEAVFFPNITDGPEANARVFTYTKAGI